MVHRQTVTRQGMTVVILASRIRDGRWRLRVQGRCDQYFTDWILPFDTVWQATSAAKRAILEEGIEAFYDCHEGV
ncbi:MAG: hypothetical protein ACQETO_12500 [Pseudomonadota bacterium]